MHPSILVLLFLSQYGMSLHSYSNAHKLQNLLTTGLNLVLMKIMEFSLFIFLKKLTFWLYAIQYRINIMPFVPKP